MDPRLLVGVGLVLASIGGVYAVITAADKSTLIYAASSTLSPGDRVYPEDLDLRSVQLGSTTNRYLGEAEVSADGVVVTRSVGAGELVPTSAVGLAVSIRVSSVVVNVGGQLAQSIDPGTVVDLWTATKLDDRSFGPPTVLVSSATVVQVQDASGLIADNRGRTVELLVPRDRIARVLEAVANGDAISLVPVGIPVRR